MGHKATNSDQDEDTLDYFSTGQIIRSTIRCTMPQAEAGFPYAELRAWSVTSTSCDLPRVNMFQSSRATKVIKILASLAV